MNLVRFIDTLPKNSILALEKTPKMLGTHEDALQRMPEMMGLLNRGIGTDFNDMELANLELLHACRRRNITVLPIIGRRAAHDQKKVFRKISARTGDFFERIREMEEASADQEEQFAEKIANWLRRNRKKPGVLFVVTGIGHTPFLLDLLHGRGFNARVGIEAFSSPGSVKRSLDFYREHREAIRAGNKERILETAGMAERSIRSDIRRFWNPLMGKNILEDISRRETNIREKARKKARKRMRK
jgi:hypothetical protein